MKKIPVADNKYQVHVKDDGTIDQITRYNEPWASGDQIPMSNFFLALIQDLEEAQDIIVAAHHFDMTGDSLRGISKLGSKIEKERNDSS